MVSISWADCPLSVSLSCPLSFPLIPLGYPLNYNRLLRRAKDVSGFWTTRRRWGRAWLNSCARHVCAPNVFSANFNALFVLGSSAAACVCMRECVWESVCLLSKCETHTPARKRERKRGKSGCKGQLEMETSLDFFVEVSRVGFSLKFLFCCASSK